MVDVWTYRAEGWTDGSDVVGYDVEATDGGIGTIDESTTAAGRQHIVVDTGFWIFGKKRLVPAGAITRVDHEDGRVYLSMTKEQIKDAPDFEETHGDGDDDHWRTYEQYYGPFGAW